MNIDFSKSAHGLIPAIIQDSETKTVLMLGYMNAESYQKTIETGKVTFFSRSKQRLWTKGEESGKPRVENLLAEDEQPMTKADIAPAEKESIENKKSEDKD